MWCKQWWQQVTSVVPDGVVLFLPSYSYEEELYQFWLAKGYIDKMEKKKKVLREPRASSNTDAVLYAQSRAPKPPLNCT